MASIVLFLMDRLGLSKLLVELIVCGSLIAAVGIGWIAVRQHERNIGWNNAIGAVKKQDDKAVAAADKVDQKAKICNDTNGWWSVIDQKCTTEDAQ